MSQDEIPGFRAAAERWRAAAEQASTECERLNCTKIADGYERLVDILAPRLLAPERAIVEDGSEPA